jgi:parallel beta-helix repeat protein
MKKSIGLLALSLTVLSLGAWSQQASAATMPAGAISVKTKGAKADGKTNDLKAFQAAVAAVGKGGIVWVPAGKYLVDVSSTNSIKLKSNMKFAMDPKAIITVKPNALDRYYVIDTNSASNVEVYGGQLVGDRANHKSKVGEWGFGVRVNSGSTVNVHDMKISNMWGDGICVGGKANGVTIQKVLSTNNRRQGLSITDSSNVKVLNSEFSYTNGTDPMYGIDIEPGKKAYATTVLIQGCNFHHNVAGGIKPHVNSKGVTIKSNSFSYSKFGIYTVGSLSGEIANNTFAHNIYQGVYISGSTTNYKIHDNFFSNNATKAVGIKDPDSNPIKTVTGMNSTTNPHLQIHSGSNITVGTNKYQK